MTEVKYDIGGGKEIIAEYDESGFMEITRECFEALIEKQIPKKPINGLCPTCGSITHTDCGDSFLDYSLEFCPNCGQALKWGE